MTTLRIGVTPGELASKPGLLLDLALSLLPRRTGLAAGLLAMLGGNSKDKVHTIETRIKLMSAALAGKNGESMEDRFRAARDLVREVARLEDAVFGLVCARLKCGMRVAHDWVPAAEQDDSPSLPFDPEPEAETDSAAVIG
jgi:hypothetical protein